MNNKNVADYTDFLGKTNKRIVQAPGGYSNLSLAWGNQKTDYGPPRTFNHKKYTPPIEPQKPESSLSQKNSSDFDYNIPIKVMNIEIEKEVRKYNASSHKQPTNVKIKSEPQPKGNYYKQNLTSYLPYGNPIMKIPGKEQEKITRQSTVDIGKRINSQSQQKEGRSCIRIIAPPPSHQRFLIGDETYNFWKQDYHGRNDKNKNHAIYTQIDRSNLKKR